MGLVLEWIDMSCLSSYTGGHVAWVLCSISFILLKSFSTLIPEAIEEAEMYVNLKESSALLRLIPASTNDKVGLWGF